MKPISQSQINSLQSAKQYFKDCYLVSSIHALAKTKNGRKVLQQNITTDGANFNVRFNNLNGRPQDFFVSERDRASLVNLHKAAHEIKTDKPHNPIINAIECAMNQLLLMHPDKKPLICRIASCTEDFEYNKPSNFLELFTGKKPIVLNEGSFRNSLRSKRENAMNLLEQMDKSGEYSFVAGTGIFNRYGLGDFHCYTVEGVNYPKEYMEIKENRTQEIIYLPFDIAIHALKFLTGYLT